MTLAKYEISNQHWVDMPEALPRSRARIKPKGTKFKRDEEEILRAEIIVNDDGTLTYDATAGIEVDPYADPKYKAIRDEVRLSSRQGTFATGVRVRPVNEQRKVRAEVTEDE